MLKMKKYLKQPQIKETNFDFFFSYNKHLLVYFIRVFKSMHYLGGS